jgi:rubrerythrin
MKVKEGIMINPQASLQVLETALQLEINGMAFYRKASNDSQNTVAKEMFAYLADAEVTHMDRIKQISGSLNLTGNWSKVEHDKGHAGIKEVFSRLAKENKDRLVPAATEIQALETGLDLEVKSIDFYTIQFGKAGDANEKAFYSSLIEEEESHFRTLKDMKFYLENPAAWFAEHERHGLDGA